MTPQRVQLHVHSLHPLHGCLDASPEDEALSMPSEPLRRCLVAQTSHVPYLRNVIHNDGKMLAELAAVGLGQCHLLMRVKMSTVQQQRFPQTSFVCRT